jgi:hypothetical protein
MNAVAERLDSKIQTVEKVACRSRSFENFKTIIFFYRAGLRLPSGYPRDLG